MERANDWSVDLIRSWGADARKEQYGTWIGWDRGITHIDLIEPRVRTLEGMMLAWSPGTDGPVEGPVVIVPDYATEAELDAWIAHGEREVRRDRLPAADLPARFPLRPVRNSRRARPDASRSTAGASGRSGCESRLRRSSGFGSSRPAPWASGVELVGGYRRQQGIFDEYAQIPTIDLSCEDYGLVWRLAENGQSPVLRLNAQSTFLGEVPVYNTIAEIRGRELPNEYVMLSAHFDSWDGASGATDNGTGSTVMLEALRILREAYPNPRRTILLGLWSGEEQGLNGSRRFVAKNPQVVNGLQALFNQDNGTGRVVNLSAQGFVGAGAHLADWLSKVPTEISQHINLVLPGIPSSGGTDHAAFVCVPAPGFNLSSIDWSYGTHTWHTNRDTFDKVVFEEIRNNAVLTAMLVYLASEDPNRVPRDQRAMPRGPQGRQMQWPTCSPGRASSQ
jgi:carboxypeptidase Q